jgi:tRNA modification GTPase
VVHQQDARRRSEGESPALRPAGDTIAAIATPPGRGGIGIVRISGPDALRVARTITGADLLPRRATFGVFHSGDGARIDEGIAIFFRAPHSYTGEDVVELQGHGGPFVMRQLLDRCTQLGARLASPGEFTQRAFLNDRLDLAQAESVADLIDAASVEAARGAARSLAGEFSRRVQALVDGLTTLRAHIEACIDFSEEEIDPADRASQDAHLALLRKGLDALLRDAKQGMVLRDGLTVVLIGRPNVGKSSLLNRLAGEDLAIVTPIAGTTRDHVRATLDLDGVPIHLIDTAGLRASTDEIERIGIERTWGALETAGAVLYITEAGAKHGGEEEAILQRIPAALPRAHVINKIDLHGPAFSCTEGSGILPVSAKTGEGVAALRAWLLETAGWKPQGEGVFLARERHLSALRATCEHLLSASVLAQRIELKAEHLRLAQGELASITGAFVADDLLGEIFSRFCIGK